MAEITATMVQTLRQRTGAGMMDCKKALSESDGDLEIAVDYLRKKGIATAAKKAGNVTSEGLIGGTVDASGKRAALVEVNSQTDFVARNAVFIQFVQRVASMARDVASLEQLAEAKFEGTLSTQDILREHIVTIGENLQLRRMRSLQVETGVIALYLHNSHAEHTGKIGVLVALESTASDRDTLHILGRQIAMHVAANSPAALSIESLDPALLEREKDIMREKARESGKPDAIIEKMIEGQVRKLYEQLVLLEQPFVMDASISVKELITEKSKELGAPIRIANYERFLVGEGIKVASSNFAEDVASMVRT